MAKTIIEINGVKMEVDLRHAKRVDELRVGDRVKVLTKGYSDYSVHAGTVIGFEPFAKLPTIVVAYIERSYGSTAGIKFLHFNAQTKDTEVIKAIDDDALDLSKEWVITTLDKEIEKKKMEIAEMEQRKDFFLREFRAYWTPVEKPREEPEPVAGAPLDPF